MLLPSLIVSSVPGPPEEIELFGRRVTGAWGWAPSVAGQPAALTAISYAGKLHLTLVGDGEALLGDVDGRRRRDRRRLTSHLELHRRDEGASLRAERIPLERGVALDARA